MSKPTLPAARTHKIRVLPLLLALIFSLTFSFYAAAQTDNAWNGVWQGRWAGGAATAVTIKDGRVVEYRFLDRAYAIRDSSGAGDTITFSIPVFQYTLTRTGAASATIHGKGAKGETPTGTLTKVDDSWNGTWSGKWVGREGGRAAAITIVDGRVTEYLLNNVPQPIQTQEVSGEKVSFGNPSYIIRISRTAPAAADADYAHVNGSILTAKLAKGGSPDTGGAAAKSPSPGAKAAKSAPTAPAWCENDCRSLCAKAAARGGFTTESCIAQYSCSKYPASPCAGPAAVDARAAQTQGGARSGSSTWYYEDCIARCDATSGSPAERGGCYAAVCAKYPKRGR
jgi:hypothetical protein